MLCVGQRNLHGGSFNGRFSVERHIDSFLQYSSAARRHLDCGGLRMTVVHDQAKTSAPNGTYRGVRLHRLQQPTKWAGNDMRWAGYAEVLALEPPRGADACTFAIDLGDVQPTLDLRELCAAHPGALFVGTDVCATKSVKLWARGAVERSNFSASLALRDFLSSADRRTLYNCGIVGGAGRLFDAFVAEMTHRVHAHYAELAARSLPPRMVVDMLALNELALSLQRRGGSLVTGWPHGPVNLPMFGNMCYQNPCYNRSFALHKAPLCGKLVLRDMTTTHYFRHKLGCENKIPC